MNHRQGTLKPASTKRLYFEDAYRRGFEAEVVTRLFFEGKPSVALDQTCFYPESGGQPSDRGTIDGTAVLHVFEEEDRIFHVLEKDIAGPGIRGEIDWARRFDHMQQHSGQHILSQAFFELLAGETLSFHLGELSSTVEIGAREISEDDLERVEKRANEIIFEDRDIKTYDVPEGEIGTIPLRRPPKKEGLIRVVEVSGFDFSACGGTHCRRTGEVGLIKIIRTDKIRNNLRFEFLCGGRARRDYSWKNRSLLSLGQKLSVHEKDVSAAVGKIQEEARQSRKRMKKLLDRMAVYEAQEIIKSSPQKVLAETWTDKTPEEAKLLALNIIRAGEFVVLYGIKGEEKDHLVLAASETLSLDMREFLPLIFSRIKAKGGGSSSLVEVVTEKRENLQDVLDLVLSALQKK